MFAYFLRKIQTLRVNNSRILEIKNAKFLGYYFHINLNIFWDFQIYISVPLNIMSEYIPRVHVKANLVTWNNKTWFPSGISSSLAGGLNRDIFLNLNRHDSESLNRLNSSWRHEIELSKCFDISDRINSVLILTWKETVERGAKACKTTPNFLKVF